MKTDYVILDFGIHVAPNGHFTANSIKGVGEDLHKLTTLLVDGMLSVSFIWVTSNFDYGLHCRVREYWS